MNRNLIYITTFGVLLIIACGILMTPARAYDRVAQGQIVYLNETYDISGATSGYTYLAYTTAWSSEFSPENWTITYMIDLPQQKELYYNYTINPDPFGERLGYWYRYNGVYESNANNRAFYVKATRPLPNATVNETYEREIMQLPPAPPIVPEKHIADYLVARGDPLSLKYNFSKASAWIFGRVNGIYDRKIVNDTVNFSAYETSGLEAGSYSLMYYSPGADRQYNLRVNGDTLEYFDSVAFKVYTTDIRPLTPPLVLDRIRWLAGVNDDNFTVYKLEVQDPKIEIISVDTILMDEYNETGVLQVRGYTNLANQSLLSLVLDEDKVQERMLGQSRKQNRWNSTVLAVADPGSMRYFDYGIPVDLQEMSPGEHNITIYGTLGAKMEVPFWRYTLPEGSPRVNQTRHYIGGYEFIPTPTPEIIIQKEIVQQIVTQIINVPVTPSDEQVHAQQAKIWWEGAGTIAVWLVAGGLMGGTILYLIRLYYRRKDGI